MIKSSLWHSASRAYVTFCMSSSESATAYTPLQHFNDSPHVRRGVVVSSRLCLIAHTARTAVTRILLWTVVPATFSLPVKKINRYFVHEFM